MYEHRDWRHLQRAAVAAHKQLGNVTQTNFCALFVPAASIALWILQHARHLAQRERLHILVAQATGFEALDRGRWLQFIPWLLGRPSMRLEMSLVGGPGPPGDPTTRSECGVRADAAASESGAATSESERRTRLDHRLQARSWPAVKAMTPAELHIGTVKSWSERGTGSPDSPRVPDLCAVFSPLLSTRHRTLLSEDGLLPLLRARVPMALFSSSEAEQLVDAYVLQAAGLELTDTDCWPNPWALPTPAALQGDGIHASVAWAADVDHVPQGASPDPRLVREIGAVLAYIAGGVESARHGPDAILSLGEPLRVAPRSKDGAGAEPEPVSVLIRLPHDMAVDSAGGQIYQLQDHLALLLEVGPVPASVMGAFPGNVDLLRRAIWATSVHRDHVAPFTQHVDAALVSHFAGLDEMAVAPTGREPGRIDFRGEGLPC